MFVYEKKLQYPVKIKNPNPALAKFILTQFGGPDGQPTFMATCVQTLDITGFRAHVKGCKKSKNTKTLNNCVL